MSNEDTLGHALLSMSKNLEKAQKEEEKRHKEDTKMNWATQGHAEIGEILRRNRENMEEFSYIIIQYLVKYIKANQGALFIINDENPSDKYIQQMATYAYDRKQMVKKRFGMTEGFLGRCVQEKVSINLKDVPDNYIRITSGLGEAPPKNILLVPMIFDGSIFGVIELASFNEIDQFHESFIEKVAESVASAISNVKLSYEDKIFEEASCGDGPVDAIFKSIERATGMEINLKDYSIKSITGGKDALGEVKVKIEKENKLFSGRGISTDIIEASAKAYINAINKMINFKKEG